MSYKIPTLNTTIRTLAGLLASDRRHLGRVPGDVLRLEGEGYYWTTPSGKTRVRHPGAYKWRTVYHASTNRVEVGEATLTDLASRCLAYEAALQAAQSRLAVRVPV